MQINLTPDYSLLVVMAIFIANYWVVRAFFLKPVNAVIVERERDITGAEKLYEEAIARFNEATAEMEAKLQQTRREASSVREQFRTQAAAHRTSVVEKTRREAEEIVGTADAELKASTVQAREQILREADALARQAATRILGRQVA